MTAGGPPPREDDHPRAEEPLLITASMLAGPVGRGRTDFERGIRVAPPLTLILMAANVAMFGWELASGALTDRETIIAAGALVRDEVRLGEWWRLVSAMFLHGGVDHLLGNMLVLYVVGIATEHAFGLARMAFIYFAAGVTGALLSIAFRPGPSVGASGAIFGLTAGVVVVLYRFQDRFYLRDKRIGFVLAIWACYQVVSGLASPYIDNFGHLGGLAGGALAARAVQPRLLFESEESTFRA